MSLFRILTLLFITFPSFSQTDFVDSLWSFSKEYNLRGERDSSIDVLLENIKNLERSDEKDIIESGLPWSVFVPRNHNKISIIDIPEYSLPEPMEYNELNIEGNFIINSGNSAVDLDFEPEQDENDTSASKNLSVIKIKI